LQVLHEHQTLHRDVSPDNIFLQDVGPPVLLDLGAARRAISDKSHKLTAILKVNYAPIEQYAEAEDLKQGPWTDLYALAAVVYSCLRNDPPLPATARVVRDSLPALRGIADTLHEHFGLEYSDRFVQAITQALAVQPGERPQSVQDFVAAMGLEAPPQLGKFDWRASLGGELLSGVKAGPGGPLSEATLPQTVAADAATTVAPQPSGRQGWRPRRSWVLGALLAVMLVLAVLVYDMWSSGAPWIAAPELAATPAPLSLPAPMPEPAASEAGPADAPVLAVQEPPTPAVAGGAGEAHGTAAGPVGAASAPKAVVKKPPSKPVAKPVPDHLLCADSSFVMRPVCIYRQCLKPENAKRPICIEERRRNQERPPQPPL